MGKWKREVLVMLLSLLVSTMICKGVTEADGMRHRKRHSTARPLEIIINGTTSTEDYCLSWRMAVEANNMRGWRTIPIECMRHVQGYMVGGQYYRDISLIIDQVYTYLDGVTPLIGDAFDAWVFDIDDTCLSNLFYYRAKRFGCDPYNPTEFKTWASRGESQAIPNVLELFNKLIEVGFKVILLTGRDEEILGEATVENLLNQGFIGYDRLIMRSPEYRGQSAIMYKSEIRRQLMEQGYKIWGNIGDQWSDLQGNFSGERTFKLPNPMYFVP